VGHLAAAEHDRDLDLVLVLQEAQHVSLLRLVVVLADFGTELDLLDDDLALVLARLLRLLLELVAVLAEVHHAADRRVGLRGDFDEVEVPFGGVLLREPDRLDPELLALLIDEPDLRHGDAVVDADPGLVGPVPHESVSRRKRSAHKKKGRRSEPSRSPFDLGDSIYATLSTNLGAG